MKTMLENNFFKKRDTQIVTYESNQSKTQVYYCLDRKYQRNFVKVIKFLRGEECIRQHRPLMYDFKIIK